MVTPSQPAPELMKVASPLESRSGGIREGRGRWGGEKRRKKGRAISSQITQKAGTEGQKTGGEIQKSSGDGGGRMTDLCRLSWWKVSRNTAPFGDSQNQVPPHMEGVLNHGALW